jgi:SPP1 gp7 family putative phage head morphogenesis protein
MTETKILDKNGQPIRTKANPDLDPDFLKGWWRLHGSTDAASKILKKPYAKHPWVYACASKIANNLARQPIIYKNPNTDEEAVHPELERLFANPNWNMSQTIFFEAVLLNLLLPTPETPGGQCFILPTDADGNPADIRRGQVPDFLYPFSDMLVKPKKGEKGKFEGIWEYIHPSGRKIPFRNDQIIRTRLYNPYDWMLGLSPYSSLEITITGDIKGTQLADRFFENNATVGGVLTTDQELLNEQIKQIQKQWADQHEGWKNAGRTALLHSGLSFDSAAKDLKDLQYTEQKDISRDTIMAVYGVSKTILGLTETVNRATANVEKELFWRDTLIPYKDKVWADINNQFITPIDPKIKGDFDTSHIVVLRGDQSQKIKDARLLIQDGVPPATAYETVGLEIDIEGMDWLDKPLVKGNRVDLSTGETVGQPSFGTPVPDGEGKSFKKSIDKSKFWETWVKATLDVPEKKFKKEMVKYLVRQRNAFLDKVDKWLKNQQKAPYKFRLSDFMLNKKVENKVIVEQHDPIYQDAIELQNRQMSSELGQAVSIGPTSAAGQAIRKERWKYLRGVNSTTFNTMGKQIEEVFAEMEGESLVKIAKRLKEVERDTMNARIASSPQTIARTETASTANTTRQKLMKKAGIEKHEWTTANDEDVRDSHIDENGSVVEIGKTFPNTGLRYPGDASGAPEETINCRCVAIAVRE